MRAARDPGAVLLDPAAGEPLARWLDYLTATRGRAALTREAYGTSVAGFLGFMQAHLGEAPVPARLAALAIADFRAWMAARRMQGVGARTLARDLAAVRGFFAWIEETQGLHCPAVLALATPKIRPGLPRPVAANDAVAVLDRVAARPAAPWIAARDVAVLTLLWSAGLRIGEALGVPWRAAPLG
ncbi:MAG: site-specific integrase, partial [Pseudomonadota bacterium]